MLLVTFGGVLQVTLHRVIRQIGVPRVRLGCYGSKCGPLDQLWGPVHCCRQLCVSNAWAQLLAVLSCANSRVSWAVLVTKF